MRRGTGESGRAGERGKDKEWRGQGERNHHKTEIEVGGREKDP